MKSFKKFLFENSGEEELLSPEEFTKKVSELHDVIVGNYGKGPAKITLDAQKAIGDLFGHPQATDKHHLTALLTPVSEYGSRDSSEKLPFGMLHSQIFQNPNISIKTLDAAREILSVSHPNRVYIESIENHFLKNPSHTEETRLPLETEVKRRKREQTRKFLGLSPANLKEL
jgi:hypothetical protein